jgi:hypothetical protein
MEPETPSTPWHAPDSSDEPRRGLLDRLDLRLLKSCSIYVAATSADKTLMAKIFKIGV